MAQTKQEVILNEVKQQLPELKAIISLNVQNGDTETLAIQELQYLQQIGLTNPAIYECEPITIIMAVKSVLKKNLTLDPDAGLVYVKTRNYKDGKDAQGKDVWKKALEIQESANGLISVARQCNRILDIDRPDVIKGSDKKVIGVKVKYLIPSFDEKRQPSTRWKEVEFDEDDFYRWQRASHLENGKYKDDARSPESMKTLKYANPNYTNFYGGVDPEFARAKAIRHGLKKLGTNPNELRASSITIPVDAKKVVIDPIADIEASKDEVTHDYIEHEEVNGHSNGNGVKVTVVEEMSIPNANEL